MFVLDIYSINYSQLFIDQKHLARDTVLKKKKKRYLLSMKHFLLDILTL